VQKAVGAAPGKMRIRSGGHQHEGTCSGDNVIVVDITRFSSYVKFEGDVVKIGAGTKLKDVYAAVGEAKMLFPGGGCGDVRTGGLVQGGGWGPYARKLGLTCDSLDGFTMIKANGERLDVTRGDASRRLLWAVSGGGGGNFGVITEYRFRLPTYEGFITQFTVTWKERSIVRAVIDEWRRNFPGDSDLRLTSFCRLGTGDDAPALLGGAFLGDPDDCAAVLRRLLPTTFAAAVMTYQAGVGTRVSQHPNTSPALRLPRPVILPISATPAPETRFRTRYRRAFPLRTLAMAASTSSSTGSPAPKNSTTPAAI
jgi:FAD/FMN-containing dehydrogenase